MVSAGVSQESVPASVPNCRGVDFETSFQLINGPGDYFTVAFNMRNIGGRSCVLDRGSYGANGSPTFPDRTDPWGIVFRASPDSENRVWGTGQIVEPPATLDPEKLVHLTIRWKTKPSNPTEPCIQPIAVNWPAWIVAPSLLKRLCSDIDVSAFSPGAFPTQSKDETSEDASNQTLKLRLTRLNILRASDSYCMCRAPRRILWARQQRIRAPRYISGKGLLRAERYFARSLRWHSTHTLSSIW
jgi:hypothetical protein